MCVCVCVISNQYANPNNNNNNKSNTYKTSKSLHAIKEKLLNTRLHLTGTCSTRTRTKLHKVGGPLSWAGLSG